MIRLSRAQTVLAAIGVASALTACSPAVSALHAVSNSSRAPSCRGAVHRHCSVPTPRSLIPRGVSSSPAPRLAGTSPSPSPTTPTPTTPAPTTSTPTPTATTPTSAPTGTGSASAYACTVTGFSDQCGPYSDPAIYGSTAGEVGYVGNQNVNLASGETGTMNANGLGDWQATVNAPAGNTAVSEWSNSNVMLTQPDNTPVPLSSLNSLTSELDIIPQTTAPGTSEDLGWDVWGGDSGKSSSDYNYEMMIWSGQINRGTCGGGTVLHTGITFGSQTWSLCEWGTGSTGEFIWYLSDASGNAVSQEDTTINIYAMLQWMIARGYYPAGYGLNMVTVGSEVCSTGGVPETVTVRKWTLSKS